MNVPMKMSKAEFTRVLERVGLPPALIEELLKELPDPVDLDRDTAVLDRHGLNRGHLTNMMGGNP
jgi:hypothetical protein